MEASSVPAQKSHRVSRTKSKKSSSGTGGKKHAVAKPGAFARRIRLSADRAEKRAANPSLPVDRTGGDASPRVVAVVGPRSVGKSTIIRNLVKHYSKRSIPVVSGPVTVVAGRKKRLTFIEVGGGLSAMIDAAKVADLVLLVIDGKFGFEMETFEFLNIAAAHGMPKVMAVLTHLDSIRDGKQVRQAKKAFKDRIWAELYDGAKVFYLSGITTTGDYLSREVLNLARFISVTKTANLRWRADHPYLLADRVEDITPTTLPNNANRSVAAYGYVRGSPLRVREGEWRLHLAGVGDLVANNVEVLPDPCPPPEMPATTPGVDAGGDAAKRKRKVSQRERIVYAPMAPEVDGISYDRDAIYINLPNGNVRFSSKAVLVPDMSTDATIADDGGSESSDGEGEKMVKSLQTTAGEAVDESLKKSGLQLVQGGKRIISGNFSDTRQRRKFNSSDDDSSQDSSGEYDSAGDESGNRKDDAVLEAHRSSTTIGNGEKASRGHVADGSGSNSTVEDSEGEEDSQSSDGGSHGDEEAIAQLWKNKMLDNAASRLQMSVSPSKTLAKFIYKKNENGEYGGIDNANIEAAVPASDSEGETDDNFFTPRRSRAAQQPNVGTGHVLASSVLDDITRMLPNAVGLDWLSDTSACLRLKHRRFGTGQKVAVEEAEDKGDDEDGAVDGDFEDLETGEVHQVAKPEPLSDEDGSDMEAIRAQKVLKKRQFDTQWDERDGKNVEGDENDDDSNVLSSGPPDVRSRKAMRDAAERAPDPRKVERARLDKIRTDALQGLDEDSRLAVEGILPGQYIRVELQDVPMEFVKYFDPTYPVLLGGLKPLDDDGNTFLRARIRRHRFKRGVLKSMDPIIFSVGWRRFQSVPVYDTEDQGGRRRFLKYTPEYLHCNATFWAPSVAPGAGVIMCQSLGRERKGFRIAGTGVVTEVGPTFEIVKKLKLVGEPLKVHKNTAFIKGMFNSELEVSKYLGANLRTVSGIRGTIKKAISEATQRGSLDRDIAKSPAGTFRAGFEDKILLSDVVFLRAWVPVEAPKFCSIAQTLLDKERTGSGKGTWRMRTIREVREANEMPIPLNKDSLYGPIERTAPKFAPMKISKKLEGALPYASKPKNFVGKMRAKYQPARKATVTEERAVVLDEKEKEQQRLLQAVYTIRNERAKKRKESNDRRLARRKKEFDREQAKHDKTSSERRKRKFALEGAMENRDSKRSKGDDDD